MSYKFEIISVTFERIFPRGSTEVPLAEAWDYYLSHQTESVSHALVREPNGKTFKTYAKQWSSWDFERGVWHISQIGLGAYGDTRISNPERSNWKFEQRYDRYWCTGFVRKEVVA